MCDRNAKSECILIELNALVFECICERTAKFHEKIFLIAELLIFKCQWQNISVYNTATYLSGDFTFQQENTPATGRVRPSSC